MTCRTPFVGAYSDSAASPPSGGDAAPAASSPRTDRRESGKTNAAKLMMRAHSQNSIFVYDDSDNSALVNFSISLSTWRRDCEIDSNNSLNVRQRASSLMMRNCRAAIARKDEIQTPFLMTFSRARGTSSYSQSGVPASLGAGDHNPQLPSSGDVLSVF